MKIINKKFYIIFLLLITIFLLSACDSVTESDDANNAANQRRLVYLSINSNNSYGIKTLKPGSGRYAYEKGMIAEIDFIPEEGYDFIGWTGVDGDKVIKEESGKYIIKMEKNNDISLNLELVKFMPRYVIFDEKMEVDYNSEIINVPHNLEVLTLKFNNKVNEANNLIAVIESVSDSEEIEELEPQSIEIEDNKIILNWNENIFFEVRDTEYFDFGKEYKLSIKQNTNDKVFDNNLKELEKDIEINFIVEEPYPETPQNIVLKRKENNIEISWLRSKTNDKIDIEEYVSTYRIYKYINKEKFTKDDADETFLVEVSEPNEKIIIRTTDTDLDLLENKYSYRIQAINNFDNESRLSETATIN